MNLQPLLDINGKPNVKVKSRRTRSGSKSLIFSIPKEYNAMFHAEPGDEYLVEVNLDNGGLYLQPLKTINKNK